MNNENSILEEELALIEQYLHRQLPAAELLSFEQRLSADADWRQKVEAVRLMMVGIQEAVLQDKLDQFHNEINPATLKAVSLQKSSWKKWMAAAAVLIIVVAGLLYFNTRPTLFDAYYTPDEGLPTYMGVADNYEFDRAMVEYKTGDYQKAITTWQQLLKDNPGNDTLSYFIGSAFLADKDTRQAKAYFDKTIGVPGSAFLQHAKWYKALILLKEGNREEAANLLKTTEHPKKEALLHKLQE
ncbi:MAG TPA: tetratricopeptide repeat protein [Niabella sp.]|nr:tetratricopeptide repeat protein [Niabella sp.]